MGKIMLQNFIFSIHIKFGANLFKNGHVKAV